MLCFKLHHTFARSNPCELQDTCTASESLLDCSVWFFLNFKEQVLELIMKSDQIDSVSLLCHCWTLNKTDDKHVCSVVCTALPQYLLPMSCVTQLKLL